MSKTVKKGKVVSPAMSDDVNYFKWFPFIVVFFTACLYAKSLLNGFIHYDDTMYVLVNPYLRDFSFHGVSTIFTSFYYGNYHPLTTLLYLLVFKCFGLEPAPYHLLSFCLHLLNTWLVFKLSYRLSERKETAILSCLLFAIHPTNVESVAWVSGLKDVLYCFFYLLALLNYARYISGDFKFKYYVLTLVFFICSLMSKSSAIALPLVLIVIDLYKRPEIKASQFLEKLPFLFLSVLFGVIALYSQASVGAVDKVVTGLGAWDHLILATTALASYLLRFLFPIQLSVTHYLPTIAGGDHLPILYYLSLPFLGAFIWLVLRRSFIRKEILFGCSFFLAALSVMLQFVQIGHHLTAERYTYVPYIGLFYVVGQFFAADKVFKLKFVRVALALVILVFSAETFMRIDVWKNDYNFFTDMIDKNPDVYLSYQMRADNEKLEGDFNGALRDYNKSIELNQNSGDLFYDRGIVFDALGDRKSAIIDYSKCLELGPKADAYNNRGWDYYKSADMQSAISDFNRAILLDTSSDKPFFNRALARKKTGDFSGAIEDYNKLLNFNKDDDFVYYNRGLCYLSISDTINACKDWTKAQELGNSNAKNKIMQYCR